MNNIRYKNANVFNNYYRGNIVYSRPISGASAQVQNFYSSNKFYVYYNKYLVNDSTYLSLTSFSGTQSYKLYNRCLTGSFDSPDYIKSITCGSLSARVSLTGHGR